MRTRLRRLSSLAIVLFMLLHMLIIPGVAAAPLPPTPCADLAVTSFTVTPGSPVLGLNAQIAISVLNQGTCASIPFVVQWKSDLLAPTGPTFQVAGLGVNESTTINLTYAFPRAGNFLTVAIVDTANAVNETNEVNNLAILSVTVQPPRPDLLITEFKISPERPVQGRVANATITVKNQGNSPAIGFLVEWQPTLLTPALIKQVNELGPGDSTTLTFDYTYPLFGTFQTAATVDSTNRVFESNEANNRIQQPVVVEPPLPDLIIDDFTINPSPPVRGSVATASIRVKNIGNSPAGSFLVRWKPSPFAPALSTQINGLAAGDSATVSFDYTFLGAGSFDSEAFADSTGRVLELNEFNNSKRILISVQPSTIDLTIKSITLTPSTPQPGNTVTVTQGERETVTIHIANLGNSPATNFIVEWSPGAFILETPGLSSLSKQVDFLGPGQELDVTFEFTYVQTGNFRAVAKVDAFNNIIETNEANNLALVNVTVNSAVDLVVTKIVLDSDPDPVSRGSKVTATITVKNVGSFPSGAFFVQWKPNVEQNIGPIGQVDGLNPNETKDVVLESVYFTTGTFTSSATVDIFNQVVESNETNNTFTRQVIVEPRKTVVEVKFTTVEVIDALADGCTPITSCDGEWTMAFAVLNPGATCNIAGKSIKDIDCHEFKDDDVDNEDILTITKTFTVTLIESTPLILGVLGVELDTLDIVDWTIGGNKLGYVIQLYGADSRWGEGPHQETGKEGECANGACYKVNYEIKVVDSPPALAMGAAAEPTSIVRLPARFPLPADAKLPPGVERVYETYLPIVTSSR